MDENHSAVVQRLFDENPRYRRLYEEHAILERQLAEWDTKKYLIPEEELERRKVQKLKLAGKDEMEQILRRWRR